MKEAPGQEKNKKSANIDYCFMNLISGDEQYRSNGTETLTKFSLGAQVVGNLPLVIR